MASMRKTFAWASATALTCLGFVLVASAAEVSPPSAVGSQTPPREVAVSPRVLAQYVGFYQLGEGGVLTVTSDGAQLSAQLTGQPAFPIYAQSPTEFFYKVTDAQISFVTDAEGRATSLVLHQNGANLTMPRIEADLARQIASRTEAKVKSQAQSPGTEAALRRLIEGARAHQQNYAQMSPALAEAIRRRAPELEAAADKLGAVQSVQFLGVDNLGDDVYDVRQENGVTHWKIALDSKGIIATAWFAPGP
jgi:hypothetical protein